MFFKIVKTLVFCYSIIALKFHLTYTRGAAFFVHSKWTLPE